MILAIKTDQPEAELRVLSDEEVIITHHWKAHRQLSNTLIETIEEQLKLAAVSLNDLQGIIVYKGPGSFTGLRIGITTANTLAYSLGIPVVGETSDDWLNQGVASLKSAQLADFVMPLYGSEPIITEPRK